MFSPAQNPTLDLFKTAQIQFQNRSNRRRVPGRAETRAIFFRRPAAPRMDRTIIECAVFCPPNKRRNFRSGPGRSRNPLAGENPSVQCNLAHAGQRKRPQLLPLQIFGEEIPLVFQASEVIRTHPARFVSRCFSVCGIEFELNGAQNCLADHFEELEIGNARARTPEGDGVLEIVPGK